MRWREAEEWIRAQAGPVRASELVHERSWSRVWRVQLDPGIAWFKVCAPVQGFEPRLTGELFGRWPDRVSEVLALDDRRGWLLLADAGTVARELGNPPEVWLAALPRYAELQRGEAEHAADHAQHCVPDLRLATWPARYEELLRHQLPLELQEVRQLAEFQPKFGELCGELAAHQLPDTIQHDDLHQNNLFVNGNQLRVLDWGDSSISQPFISLVVTFRFLEEFNGLSPRDSGFARLRDAYLEPWGSGLGEAFELSMRVGGLVHCFGWMRQRDALPADAVRDFDVGYRTVLRRAMSLLHMA